jgi:hypothetical protein
MPTWAVHSRLRWLGLVMALGCGSTHKSGVTVTGPGGAGADAAGDGAAGVGVTGPGPAGAGAAGPRAGEPCQSNKCGPGVTCEHVGVFTGICTATCSSDPACGLLNPHSRCFGSVNQECALACTIDTDCPKGTICVSLGQIGSQKACRLQ